MSWALWFQNTHLLGRRYVQVDRASVFHPLGVHARVGFLASFPLRQLLERQALLMLEPMILVLQSLLDLGHVQALRLALIE